MTDDTGMDATRISTDIHGNRLTVHPVGPDGTARVEAVHQDGTMTFEFTTDELRALRIAIRETVDPVSVLGGLLAPSGRMDEVRFYVRRDSQARSSIVACARKGNGWWTCFIDELGVSTATYGKLPSLSGIRPYVMTKDISEVEAVLAEIRDSYCRDFLIKCGLADPMERYIPKQEFVDAVIDPRGGICTMTKVPTTHRQVLWTMLLLIPGEGISRHRAYYPDEERPTFPEDQEHLDASQAEVVARVLIARMFDESLETIRGWCG